MSKSLLFYHFFLHLNLVFFFSLKTTTTTTNSLLSCPPFFSPLLPFKMSGIASISRIRNCQVLKLGERESYCQRNGQSLKKSILLFFLPSRAAYFQMIKEATLALNEKK
ncbi:hypothetical protein NC651_006268 [Populus alba x Populus x berolinensis]|nr:hypothetical protein NC651_006268 [Populus alba x Populus x berolinensis]